MSILARKRYMYLWALFTSGAIATSGISIAHANGHTSVRLAQHSATARVHDDAPLTAAPGTCVSRTIDSPLYRLSDSVQPLTNVAADGSTLPYLVPAVVRVTAMVCTKAVAPSGPSLAAPSGSSLVEGTTLRQAAAKAPRTTVLSMRNPMRVGRHPMYPPYRLTYPVSCGFGQSALSSWDFYNGNTIGAQYVVNDRSGAVFGSSYPPATAPANGLSTYYAGWSGPAHPNYQTQGVQLYATTTGYSFNYAYCQ